MMASPPHPDGRKSIVLVADDYGLAPGVDDSIRTLIAGGKLSGTGCMTLFPEWPEAAERLKAMPESKGVAIGLHLTLTDFSPLSGAGPLGAGRMPTLSRLIRASYMDGINVPSLEGELDAQLEAFASAMGRMPDYIDGHQHVHFLPQVRHWLTRRRARLVSSGTPWLRGGPSTALAEGWAVKVKVAIVALLARGFEAEMTAAGFAVKGPLAGFYDWNAPRTFVPAMLALSVKVQDSSVVMCHPGMPDDLLKSRDRLVAARAVEFEALKRFDGWRIAKAGGGRERSHESRN